MPRNLQTSLCCFSIAGYEKTHFLTFYLRIQMQNASTMITNPFSLIQVTQKFKVGWLQGWFDRFISYPDFFLCLSISTLFPDWLPSWSWEGYHHSRHHIWTGKHPEAEKKLNLWVSSFEELEKPFPHASSQLSLLHLLGHGRWHMHPKVHCWQGKIGLL